MYSSILDKNRQLIGVLIFVENVRSDVFTLVVGQEIVGARVLLLTRILGRWTTRPTAVFAVAVAVAGSATEAKRWATVQPDEPPFFSLSPSCRMIRGRTASGIGRNGIDRGRAAPEIDNTVNRRTVAKDPPALIPD